MGSFTCTFSVVAHNCDLSPPLYYSTNYISAICYKHDFSALFSFKNELSLFLALVSEIKMKKLKLRFNKNECWIYRPERNVYSINEFLVYHWGKGRR